MNTTQTNQASDLIMNAYINPLNQIMKLFDSAIEKEQAKRRPQNDAIKKATKDNKQCITV